MELTLVSNERHYYSIIDIVNLKSFLVKFYQMTDNPTQAMYIYILLLKYKSVVQNPNVKLFWLNMYAQTEMYDKNMYRQNISRTQYI